MTIILTDPEREAVIALLEQEADDIEEEFRTVSGKRRVRFLRRIVAKLKGAEER